MKFLRSVLTVIFIIYLIMTIIMASNVDEMVNKMGLFSFFRMFRNWVVYGFLFVLVLIIIDNIRILTLKNVIKKTHLEITDLQYKLNAFLKKDKKKSEKKDT